MFEFKKSHLSFSKFLCEEEKFLNLDDDKSGKTLGKLDPQNPKDKKLILKLENLLNDKDYESFIDDLLIKLQLENSAIKKSRKSIIQLFIDNFTGNGKMFFEMTDMIKNKKNIVKLKSSKYGVLLKISDIKNKFGSYFSSNFIEEFYKFKPETTATTGPSEFLLAIFTELFFSTDHGDLMDSKNNRVEIKAQTGAKGGAAIASAREKLDSIDITFEKINKLLQTINKPNIVLKNKELSKSAAADLLSGIDTLLKNKVEPTLIIKALSPSDLFSSNQQIVNSAANILTSKVKDIGTLKNFLTSIDLLSYSFIDNFSTFLISSIHADEIFGIRFNKLNDVFSDTYDFVEKYIKIVKVRRIGGRSSGGSGEIKVNI